MKSWGCVGIKIDFSMLTLTPREEKRLSTMEVEIRVSSLDCAASRDGEYKDRWAAMGSSGESKWQDPVLKMLRAYHEPWEFSVGYMPM